MDDIPTTEEIEAESQRPLDADDLEIIESVLIPAGVLGTTLAKVQRMRSEAMAQALDDIEAMEPGNFV